MTAERYWRIKSIFHLALDQPPSLRRPYAIEACHGDDLLLEAVLELLSSDSDAPDFLARPIVGDQFRIRTHDAAERAVRR